MYVLLGAEDSKKPIRFFIAKNRGLEKFIKSPRGWEDAGTGFMSLKAVEQYEGRWDTLLR